MSHGPASGFPHAYSDSGIYVYEPAGGKVFYVGVKSEYDPSLEETRWRHYLDTGRASVPQSGTWATLTSPVSASQGQDQVQASSSSSSGESKRSGLNPDGPPAAATVADGESVTSISTCSLCAARLASSERQELKEEDDSQRVGAHWDDESEESGGTADTEKPGVSRRRHRFDNERGGGSNRRSSKTDRRLRRLEKTAESLSHGLIVALTQLKSGGEYAEQRRPDSNPGPLPSAPHPPRQSHSNAIKDEIESVSRDGAVDDDDDDDDCRILSSAVARMGLSENAHGEIGAMASSLQQNSTDYSSSLEKSVHRLLCGPQLPSTVTTTETSVAPRGGPENAFSCIATGNDGFLFTTSKEWSPISRMLSPILKFITSSDVSQFLKRAEVHAGLSSTQLFDLFWVLDNLFNVHGGILIYCLRKSLNTMDGISRSLGSDEWSHDLEFLRKLDEAYLKDLHPHIYTDGSSSSVAGFAWKSYCLNLSQIFFERFPCRQTVAHFRDLSDSYTGYFNPVITTSYIDDLVTLWTPIHPALLEVTRWLEPFIDYGPDCNRATPLYDATIALERRARELLSRMGAKEPEVSWQADSLFKLLREHRSGDLVMMKSEVERVMKDISRDFDAANTSDGVGNEDLPSGSGSGSGSGEEAALVERAKQVTGCWQTVTTTTASPSGQTEGGGSSVWLRHALALHEVRVMKSYRLRLLREGVASARIRREVLRVLSPLTDGRKGCAGDMKDIFWDQISL